MRKVANRLRTSTRSGDTIARVGGDEFFMLLDGIEDYQELEGIGQRLREWFEPPFQVCGNEVHLTASIGLAYPAPEELKQGAYPNEVEALTRTADRAMYEAKQLTGTTWQIECPSNDSGGARQIQRANRIRDGLEQGEFLPHYQPIYRLEDCSVIAVEALARWSHPERGLVSPGEFIPIAEQSDLICEIGEAILTQACREMARLLEQAAGTPDLRLFVNLSPRQLERSKTIQRLSQLVDEEAPAGLAICFEVTETELLEHLSRVVELRERG
ncbi:MAG: EAL domain-containing protein, partial [Bradymonadaceae bacterium]